MKKLILLGLLLGSTVGFAQTRGTPSQLQVRVDANGYLLTASGVQVNPVTTVQFNNARLAIDSSGNLMTVGSGGSGTIEGTIADTQIAFGTAADTIGGSNDFTYDGTLFNSTGAAQIIDDDKSFTLSDASGILLSSPTDPIEIESDEINLTLGSGDFNIGNNASIGSDGVGFFAGLRPGYIQLDNAGAIRGSVVDAQTWLMQVYDNNTGPGYVTFGTATNGDSPSFVLTSVNGVAVSIRAVYSSNDGTAGLTQTCAAAVVAVTVKNGLITAITCP